MKTAIIFIVILASGALGVAAQEKACRNITITDDDRRGFNETKAIMIDVDGDGKPDTIKPRTFKLKATAKDPKGVKETHWIAFDLKTSKGKAIKSFFKYAYGSNFADYWVYALIPCKIKGGAKRDLLFYMGDDTSSETVVLQNRGTSFKIHSRKTTDF